MLTIVSVGLAAVTLQSIGTIRPDANCMAFAPTGNQLAVGHGDMTLRIYGAGLKLERTLRQEGRAFALQSVAYNPKGGSIAGGAENGRITIWNLSNNTQFSLTGHSRAVNNLSFNKAGTRLMSTSDDDTVRIWDLNTRQTVLTIRGNGVNLYGAEFTSDGTKVVVGTLGKGMSIYNASNGQLIRTFGGHYGGAQDASANAAYTRAVSAGRDKRLAVWDLKTNNRISYLSGHEDYVMYVRYSPNGKWFASSSSDATVILWNASTLKQEAKLTGMSWIGSRLAWNASSTMLATINEYNLVRVYQVK
ncbi:MAG: WD40 repeat domain-containing protein [Fimbriimonadales bacterium]|nr:WD40 repeat domain-containing protein [Fimbriimonadales bacterium]